MIILGIYHYHDACAALYDDYKLLAAVAQERVTRIKGDGGRFPTEAVEECLAQAGLDKSDIGAVVLPRTHYPAACYRTGARLVGGSRIRGEANLLEAMLRSISRDPHRVLDVDAYLAGYGLAGRKTFFYNHHMSHALGTLFQTDWADALIYTSDGGGDRVYYSARHLHDGQFTDIFGGEPASLSIRRHQSKNDSLGLLYYYATQALGMVPLRHEGKVLGLAAFGNPVYARDLATNYWVDADGQVRARDKIKDTARKLDKLAKTTRREDVAASVQQVLEDITLEALGRMLARNPSRNLGLSGGVFANVKLTQRIAAKFDLDEVFVYPAMSDQGMAAGGVLQYLYERDGLPAWLSKRARFGNVLFGRDYMASADEVFAKAGARRVADGNVGEAAGRLIADGAVIGTYLGPMEYGPRALGARSIMVRATDRAINDELNKRLDRTDFMPFAPVIRTARAADVFLLPKSLHYTAQYMTVTCDVREDWRPRIPAVVHVDGTARPQLIARAHNPVYHDILHAYERITGNPVLINTSFNVHEEPIINKPEEAWTALRDNRVDYVATEKAVWARG